MKTVGMLVLLLALPLISAAQDPGVLVVEPVILAGGPDAYESARGVSPNLEISMLYQPDLNAAAVDAWRFVVVEAWLDDPGIWVASRYAYETYGTGLVDFENDGWSDWTDWDDPDATQRFTITGLDAETPDGARKYYLLALQVRDVTGAVSTELDYCVTVHHFYIDTGLAPELTVRESHLESAVFTGTHGMVHDARGRRVASLLDEALPAGPHTIEWRGRDTSGQPVAAGVYFVRLVTDEGASVTRAVLVK